MTNKQQSFQWKKICQKYIQSGLPKTIFCKENGIKLDTLYRELYRYYPDQIKSSYSRQKSRKKRNSSQFLPVKYAPQKAESKNISLKLKTGHEITVDLNFEQLSSLIKELERSHEATF